MRFQAELLRNFHEGTSREWLLANGIGGYASSTLIGVNTRRYHGLLVAALNPPGERVVLLSKLEEEVEYHGIHELSTNQYADVVHPKGYQYLESFELNPLPVWSYRIRDAVLQKQIFTIYGSNATVIRYRSVESSGPLTLRIRPLINSRDFHTETHAWELPWSPTKVLEDGRVAVFQLADFLPILHMASDHAHFETNGYWYYRFLYNEEVYRGLPAQEDLYSPGFFTSTLNPGESVSFLASLEPVSSFDAEELHLRALARLEATQNQSNFKDSMLRTLALAADSFLVERPLPVPPEMPWLNDYPSRTVIAGYHWFSDWGRDTMIALPGLTLVTGRFEEAKAICATFASHCEKGLIPNRFLDSGLGADYNTVDASLWFFWAVQKLLDYTEDFDFVQRAILPSLREIISFYRQGTEYGIYMEEDGLITQGQHGYQLTWMDAKVGDWVVTPRHGKPVEINALWINALRVMQALEEHFDGDSIVYKELAQKATRSFCNQFWNQENQCLDDVVGDPTIRPNQILAVSLPVSILSKEKARKVVDTVQSELYTKYGLRSLSPRDSRYVGHYGGDPWHRDGAYHQGTVWGWLIGPFITAYVKVHGNTPAARKKAASFLEPFRTHLTEAGLGSISEIFDGDPPHHPRGCISQAWSVAEVLRAAVEDVRLDTL